MSQSDASPNMASLVALVERLRGPNGCPWDRRQALGDVAAYLVEEAHETAAAIGEGDLDAVRDELGDLLFQVAFVTVLAREAGAFELSQAIDGVIGKMVARHPHVFGDQELEDARAVEEAWARRKLEQGSGSALSGIPRSLPALVAAYRMSQKAAALGFDWAETRQVLDKLQEELDELRRVIDEDSLDRTALREEIGDLLFTVVNLARHLDVDPEAAAAAANRKFRRRFEHVERHVDFATAPELEEMERLWQEAKRLEGSLDGEE